MSIYVDGHISDIIMEGRGCVDLQVIMICGIGKQDTTREGTPKV